MKKTIITIIIGGAILLVIILILGTSNPPASESLGDFGQSPDLKLKDYDGNEIALADFRGKVAVFNSWAVWCPFCRDELSDFASLQEEFGGKITVVAIDRQESLEKAKGFTDSLGITNDLTFLLDSSDSFYKTIGGFSMPETIFVDPDGVIRIHKRGPMPLSEMREKVTAIMEETGL